MGSFHSSFGKYFTMSVGMSSSTLFASVVRVGSVSMATRHFTCWMLRHICCSALHPHLVTPCVMYFTFMTSNSIIYSSPNYITILLVLVAFKSTNSSSTSSSRLPSSCVDPHDDVGWRRTERLGFPPKKFSLESHCWRFRRIFEQPGFTFYTIASTYNNSTKSTLGRVGPLWILLVLSSSSSSPCWQGFSRKHPTWPGLLRVGYVIPSSNLAIHAEYPCWAFQSRAQSGYSYRIRNNDEAAAVDDGGPCISRQRCLFSFLVKMSREKLLEAQQDHCWNYH